MTIPSLTRFVTRLVLPSTSLILAGSLYAGDEQNNLSQALRTGEATLSLRYRYEHVKDDNFSDSADASTLKLRLAYQTGRWHHWSGRIELDAAESIAVDHFNSGEGTSGPSRNRYPVVADPDYAEINEFFLDYRNPAGSLSSRWGRQRIALDNQRFIGSGSWRQNDQTFDSARLDWQLNPELTLNYLNIRQANRIFGDDVPAGNHDHNSHALHAHWTPSATHTVDAYHYRLDNRDVSALSSETTGIRWGIQSEPENPQWIINLETALQRDTEDQPVDYSAAYWRLDSRIRSGPVHWQLGIESLGGSQSESGAAFQTPLASLHAFNGWADRFVNIPNVGLQDAFVGLQGKWQDWSWLAVAHHFEAEAGNMRLGRELDASLSRRFANGNTLVLKAASFDGDNGRADANKVWLMFSMSL